MNFNTEKAIKTGLAILLLACLLHLPYGYYELFRFIAVVGFAILAWFEYERKNIIMAIVFVALALLFQPLSKVPMGRQVWIIIDVIVAAGLIIAVFFQPPKEQKN